MKNNPLSIANSGGVSSTLIPIQTASRP